MYSRIARRFAVSPTATITVASRFTVPKKYLYNTSAAPLRSEILLYRCRTHVSPFGQVSSHAMSVVVACAYDFGRGFTWPTMRALCYYRSRCRAEYFSVSFAQPTRNIFARVNEKKKTGTGNGWYRTSDRRTRKRSVTY